MVFKTIVLFVGYIGFTQFYPWVKLTVLPSFYPILPNWFYPLGKTTMPTLVGDPFLGPNELALN